MYSSAPNLAWGLCRLFSCSPTGCKGSPRVFIPCSSIHPQNHACTLFPCYYWHCRCLRQAHPPCCWVSHSCRRSPVSGSVCPTLNIYLNFLEPCMQEMVRQKGNVRRYSKKIHHNCLHCTLRSLSIYHMSK
jgi:hypothetical protein